MSFYCKTCEQWRHYRVFMCETCYVLEKERLIQEFLEDLKGINYQMSVKRVRYFNINGTIEKWEGRLK